MSAYFFFCSNSSNFVDFVTIDILIAQKFEWKKNIKKNRKIAIESKLSKIDKFERKNTYEITVLSMTKQKT